jgi:hypothetical protein
MAWMIALYPETIMSIQVNEGKRVKGRSSPDNNRFLVYKFIKILFMNGVMETSMMPSHLPLTILL